MVGSSTATQTYGSTSTSNDGGSYRVCMPLLSLLSSPEKSPAGTKCRRDVKTLSRFEQHMDGIQWRAHNLPFDFVTYPNYQKFPKINYKSRTVKQNLQP